MNKTLLAGLGVMALMTASCGEDYLDTVPTDAVGSATAIGTTENAVKALNGIALTMASQQYMGSQGNCGENEIISHMENYASQDYHYNLYAPGWAPLHNMTFHLNDNSVYDYYGFYYYYTVIGQANTIIANIDAATGTQEERDYVKASALTYRAYAYEKLMHYYVYRFEDSENGTIDALPLRLDESTGDLPYSSYNEVYAQIYKDLDDAIALFGSCGIDRPSGEVWIANVNVAHAVYVRAAQAKHDWNTVVAHTRPAMAGYPLMSNTDYANGFCKPTSEWIFGSFAGSEENQWYWTYGTQFSCNGYYASAAQTGAGAISRDLLARIPNNDARKQLFISEDKFPDYEWDATKNPDPYYSTYGMIGIYPYMAAETDEEFFELQQMLDPNDVYSQVEAWLASKTPSGLAPAYQAGFYYIGAHVKFWVFDTPGLSYLPFIRSSEMLLSEAEAYYNLNNADKAQAALVELNAGSGRNPEYTCTKTGNDLFEEIVDYRALELWGEGFQWSDYKRWNRTLVRKGLLEGGSAHADVAKTITPDFGNKWTWVIPKKEVDYNKGLNQGEPEATK